MDDDSSDNVSGIDDGDVGVGDDDADGNSS